MESYQDRLVLVRQAMCPSDHVARGTIRTSTLLGDRHREVAATFGISGLTANTTVGEVVHKLGEEPPADSGEVATGLL